MILPPLVFPGITFRFFGEGDENMTNMLFHLSIPKVSRSIFHNIPISFLKSEYCKKGFLLRAHIIKLIAAVIYGFTY